MVSLRDVLRSGGSDDDLDAARRGDLIDLMDHFGWEELVVVPVGAGDELAAVELGDHGTATGIGDALGETIDLGAAVVPAR